MCHLIGLLPSFRLKEEFNLDNTPQMAMPPEYFLAAVYFLGDFLSPTIGAVIITRIVGVLGMEWYFSRALATTVGFR